MDAVTSGKVKIVPERYTKTYLDWLSEKRDWPVGRQLWWGHRIPVWTRKTTFDNYPQAMIGSIVADAEKGRIGSFEPDKSTLKANNNAVSYLVDHANEKITTLVCVPPGNEKVEKELESASMG